MDSRGRSGGKLADLAKAAPRGRHGILPILLLLIVLSGCSGTAAGNDQASYELSANAADEILFLRPYGGTGALVPWYHLYGDGRLVRDIVHQYHQDPIFTHEVQLSASDVDLLFQLIVGSSLPDLTEQRLVEQAGRPLPRVIDGSSTVLTLSFASYTRPGEDPVAPFRARVEMHAPHYLARTFPQIPEIQSFATLVEALDDFFAQPAEQVIFGDLYRPPAGGSALLEHADTTRRCA